MNNMIAVLIMICKSSTCHHQAMTGIDSQVDTVTPSPDADVNQSYDDDEPLSPTVDDERGYDDDDIGEI